MKHDFKTETLAGLVAAIASRRNVSLPPVKESRQ